jgi:hypothetical protein
MDWDGGGGGATAWPPKSPYLIPLDFFLRGCIKELVYQTKVQRVDEAAYPNNCSMWECYTTDAAKL